MKKFNKQNYLEKLRDPGARKEPEAHFHSQAAVKISVFLMTKGSVK